MGGMYTLKYIPVYNLKKVVKMQIRKVKTLSCKDDCCLRDIINKTFNCFSRSSSQNISCKNKYYRRKSIFPKF